MTKKYFFTIFSHDWFIVLAYGLILSILFELKNAIITLNKFEHFLSLINRSIEYHYQNERKFTMVQFWFTKANLPCIYSIP